MPTPARDDPRPRLRRAAEALRAGRRVEAAALCDAILATHPDEPDALHVAAIAANLDGRPGDARRLVERAIAHRPGDASFHNTLGNVLIRLGPPADAVPAFRRAVELDPDYADGWFNLGNTLQRADDPDGAVEAHERAHRLAPERPDVLLNLGASLVRRRGDGDLERAEVCFRRLLEVGPEVAGPQRAGAHNNLAAIHFSRGDTEEALACFRRALEVHPDFATAHLNLGLHHGSRGDLAEAVEAYRGAARAAPEQHRLHLNLGLTMLLAGVFEEGWEEYEWRWRNRGAPARKAGCPQPVWDGAPLDGRRILLTAEQGLGDLVQFIRYAPLVRDRAGVVLAEARPPLARLFATCPGVERVWVDDGEGGRPGFDLQVPLLSLPRLFGTDLETIPADVPYLTAAPEVTPEIAALLDDRKDGLRVGIVWAGSPGNGMDAQRSCPLEHFAPLAAVPGVRLYNLLYGERGREVEEVPELGIVDLGPHLGDLYDTAAVVREMDLVITVDTSMAHLAGALGAPVWTLLCTVPDWRWLLHRDDTPWYPTMRLFRQRSEGDWGELLERVGGALRARRDGR